MREGQGSTRTGRIFFRSFLFSLFHHPFDVHFRTPNGVPVWTSIGEDISTSKTMKNDVRLGCPAQTKRTTLKRPMDVPVLVGSVWMTNHQHLFPHPPHLHILFNKNQGNTELLALTAS